MAAESKKDAQDVVEEAVQQGQAQIQDAVEKGQEQLKKVAEAGQVQMTSMFEQTQSMMQQQFDLLKEYSTVYNSMLVETTQLMLNQGLTYREESGNLMADNLQKLQALVTKQQDLAVKNVETFNEQMQASYERTAKLFTPNFGAN